jgi:hypothetical protein
MIEQFFNNITEIWKDIKGYEGLYQVSNYGRIKSLKFGKEKILKTIKHKNKYIYINLYKNYKTKAFEVHRLVLEAFIGLCPQGMDGCHNDNDTENNFIGNLRWDTFKNNMKDKIKHNTNNVAFGSNHGNSKLKDNKIKEMRKLYDEGKLILQEIANKYNIALSTTWRIINHKTWKHID